MKIKVNAIGLGESKFILLSEGLIFSGILLTSAGLLLLRKSQCWTFGKSAHQLEYFNTIINTLESAFKKK